MRFLSAIVLVIFVSCTSSKKIIYFQDLKKSGADSVILNAAPRHVIKPGDILNITVSSSNPEADKIFNDINAITNIPAGILVDRNGNIDIPYTGQIRVSGLTSDQARDSIQLKLATHLKNPSVNFRIVNYTISVLGDVAKPGTYTIPNEKINILQAISLAGDLNITAKRNNILVIREENEKEIFYKVDLRSKKLMKSEFFNLRSNDMVYVEPSKSKITQNDNRTFQIATLGATILSLVTIILIRADL